MLRNALLTVVFCGLLAGCAAETAQTPSGAHGHGPGEAHITKHFEGSMVSLSDNAVYSLELVVPAGEVAMGGNSLELIVHHGRGGDVAGADIAITPWMPSMGHGVNEKPRIIERGGGLYSLENVVFSMTGHWQLKVRIEKDGQADTALFEFPNVQAHGHAHMMGHATAVPAGLDTASQKKSATGLFSVSYAPEPAPAPLNRLHSWNLTLADKEGRPVSGATVSVVGDMPEHGHGLPTRPEVVAAGAGRYTAMGMKFNMPGWWVVTFHISAGEASDNVSFNLLLQ